VRAAALRDLAALAQARRARDLARLEALIAEARGLEDEIAALADTEARDMAEGQVPFAVMGMRLAWAEAAIAAKRRRIAALAVEIAGVRAEARVSLGKHEALAALLAKADRADRAERDRADEIAVLVGRNAVPAGRADGDR
jgi:hypothetical protein